MEHVDVKRVDGSDRGEPSQSPRPTVRIRIGRALGPGGWLMLIGTLVLGVGFVALLVAAVLFLAPWLILLGLISLAIGSIRKWLTGRRGGRDITGPW